MLSYVDALGAHPAGSNRSAGFSRERALSAGSLRRRPRHRDCAEHSPACRASCVFVDEQNLFAVEG